MPKSELKRCTRCVLPETYPNISFNEEGLCHLCQKAPPVEDLIKARADLKLKMDEVLQQVKGKGEYDVIVAYSGGKDSSYTLVMMQEEYNLRCLAVTIDNGFIAERAVKNCYAVTKGLGIDFVMFTPAPKFMNTMYRVSATQEDIHAKSAITRASSICNSCITLINNHMIKLALQTGTKIIAGGYIGGQVPKDAAVLSLNVETQEKLRQPQLGRYERAFGKGSKSYFAVPDRLMGGGVDDITVINPMLTISLTEEQIIDRISKYGWEKTKDTGKHSTNCRLNDLGIAVHFKKHRFHPYVAEVAEQVRTGLMDRDYAIAKLADIPDFEDLTEQAQQIGLDVAKVV